MWIRRKCWIDSADNCGQQSNPFIGTFHWNLDSTRTEPQTLFGQGTDGKVVVVVCAYQCQHVPAIRSVGMILLLFGRKRIHGDNNRVMSTAVN